MLKCNIVLHGVKPFRLKSFKEALSGCLTEQGAKCVALLKCRGATSSITCVDVTQVTVFYTENKTRIINPPRFNLLPSH